MFPAFRFQGHFPAAPYLITDKETPPIRRRHKTGNRSRGSTPAAPRFRKQSLLSQARLHHLIPAIMFPIRQFIQCDNSLVIIYLLHHGLLRVLLGKQGHAAADHKFPAPRAEPQPGRLISECKLRVKKAAVLRQDNKLRGTGILRRLTELPALGQIDPLAGVDIARAAGDDVIVGSTDQVLIAAKHVKRAQHYLVVQDVGICRRIAGDLLGIAVQRGGNAELGVCQIDIAVESPGASATCDALR